MKAALIIFSLLSLFLMTSSEAALKDGTNFAIKPDSIRCISTEVPDDFGAVGLLTSFYVTSNCGEWCDFTGSTVLTDPGNPVSIPVCLNTFGKQVNETKKIRFTISARGKQKDYNYGICVAPQEDQDIGSGNPCAVVNVNQKYFEIKTEQIIYAEPNKETEYEIEVYSTLKLELDITVQETGKTFKVTTVPQQKTVLKDKITVKQDTSLNVKAVVSGCTIPSCTKTSSSLVTIQKIPEYAKTSGNFSLSLMPESATTKKSQPVKYYLEIKNYGEEKEYSVELKLPEGLKSTFNTTKKSVRNSEDFTIEIEPTGSEPFYTFTVDVRGQALKSVQGTLSVNELANDLSRAKTTDVLDPDALSNINAVLVNTRDSSLADDLKSFSDLANKPKDVTQIVETASSKKSAPKKEGGFDMTTIALIIAVVVLAGVFVMFKMRKKPAQDGDGENWSQEGRY